MLEISWHVNITVRKENGRAYFDLTWVTRKRVYFFT
jgi:hypothetical protein